MKSLLISLLASIALATGALTFTGCAATGTHKSTGEYIDDAAVTAKVKSALIADNTVSAFDVEVETYKGHVQLSGFVDTDAQRQRAEQLARGVAGVTDVSNNIRLKTASTR